MEFAYNPARANIGSLGMNKTGKLGCVSPVYIAFKTVPGYEWYFDNLLKTNTFMREVETCSSGSVRQAFLFDDFSMIKISIPNQVEFDRFNASTSNFRQTISAINKETHTLEAIRDTLLPKIMSGEIDVSKINVKH